MCESEAIVFGKRVIRLGDPTTHGGVVVSATDHLQMFGKPVVRLGDKVACPISGHGVCSIVEGDPLWSIDGIPVALEGHKTSCGASLISSLPNVGRAYEGMRIASGGSAASGTAALASEVMERAVSTAEEPYALRFRALDPESAEPLPYRSYIVTLEDGSMVSGTTDADGYTDPMQANEAKAVDIHVQFRAPNKGLEPEELV